MTYAIRILRTAFGPRRLPPVPPVPPQTATVTRAEIASLFNDDLYR